MSLTLTETTPAAPARPPETYPYILAVDDDPNVLRAVARDLRKKYADRFRIMTANSGAAALESAKELTARHDSVALFLVDQRMPGMTGVELLERAREAWPDSKRVLLTAYADIDASIQAINKARIDYYLTKPWDPPEERLYPILDDMLDDWVDAHPPPFKGMRLLGHRWSPESHALRDFLGRSQVPHRWVDVERRTDDAVSQKLIDEVVAEKQRLPLLVFQDGTRMVAPAIGDVADKLGMQTHAGTTQYDLVIIGAGPAGLAAAVYGASEGLKTLMLDMDAPGGQAGTSSRIENYLGFPTGLTGADLTRRGVAQARKFGVEILAPRRVVSLKAQGVTRMVTLDDGSEVAAQSVMIATGLAWRTLDVPGLAQLQGAGVYYGATLSEAISCADEDVHVIGGANSAGQGALYFARYARSVNMLVRSPLEKSMSYYLIEQIRNTPNIHVLTSTEVTAVQGEQRLEGLTYVNRDSGQETTVPACSLFIFIGAVPQTEWLKDLVPLDERGYVLSGPALTDEQRQACGWPDDERRPALFETGVPGVFVAGDVRAGSVKRVASAVGEGAVSVQLIHQYLSQVR